MDSSIVPGIYDESFLDSKIGVDTDDAYEAALRLSRELGVLVGQSSGAAYEAALRVAGELSRGTVVTIFCDGGDKYMTTPMWRELLEERGIPGRASKC